VGIVWELSHGRVRGADMGANLPPDRVPIEWQQVGDGSSNSIFFLGDRDVVGRHRSPRCPRTLFILLRGQ